MNKTCPNCRKLFGPADLAVPHNFKRQMHCSKACHTAIRRRPEYVQARFWEQVSKGDGCWIWTGRLQSAGYGEMRATKERRVLVHRYSYALANGEIPKGQLVLHRCDTPLCVRPEHLFLGSDRTNSDDKVAKRRHAYGERISNAILTASDVLDMRRLRKEGWANKALAAKFGIGANYVSQICHRKVWAHV